MMPKNLLTLQHKVHKLLGKVLYSIKLLQQIAVGTIMIVVVTVSSVQAELKVQFPTQTERRVVDAASWMTVLTAITLDTKASWQCEERLHCFTKQGERLAVVYGAAFLVKWLVHRDRPCNPSCGIDNPHSSFFSAHTAAAFQTLGGPRSAVVIPLAGSTGVLRVAAGKHWMTDVIAGAAVGTLASRIR